MGRSPFNSQIVPTKDFRKSKAQCKEGSPFALPSFLSLPVYLQCAAGHLRKPAGLRGVEGRDCLED